MSKDLDQILANNRAWAAGVRERDPKFFQRLLAQQAPKFLWIGCSDSRVPANQLTGLLPGDVFVHRNVANLVVHTDLNCLSVLQYAVDVLKVEHVIVCGHYGCGGVTAALHQQKFGLIDNWLRHVQDVATSHRTELDAIVDDAARIDRLCELNVIAQVVHVSRTTIVQDAWARGQPLALHGVVYRLQDGLLKELGFSVASPAEIEAYQTAAAQARG